VDGLDDGEISVIEDPLEESGDNDPVLSLKKTHNTQNIGLSIITINTINTNTKMTPASIN
jgi:hypothetical protein